MIGPVYWIRTSICKKTQRTQHMSTLTHHEITLHPEDGERLANLSGPFDEHLRQVELRLGVEIATSAANLSPRQRCCMITR